MGGSELPPPIIVGLRELEPNIIMVLTLVPRSDYIERRGSPVRYNDRGNPLYDVSARQKLWETQVEVIDAEQERLLLAERVSGYIIGFADDEHVYGYRLDEQGEPFVDIYSVRVVGTPSSGRER